MKRKLLGIFFLVMTVSGCASSYTGIRQVNGNTYMITRVRQGLITVDSDLMTCEAAGEKMNCKTIAEP